MPVYNGERFLSESLAALLVQTFGDFELVIADNASTDATADICRDYAARDSRIRYVRNERNIGVYRNYNKVFQLATGEYFKYAAADDLCAPELVARCVAVLDAEPGVVATYAKTRFIDPDGNFLGVKDPGWHLMSDSPYERLKYVLVSGHWVNVPFGLIRSRELTGTRLFPLYLGGDCRLLGELCLKGKFFEIPEYLFFRRIHPQAASQNHGFDWQSLFFKGRRGRVELPLWHICLDHCRTIVGSRLSGRDKVSCLGLLSGRMFASKRELLRELYTAGRYLYTTKLLTSDEKQGALSRQ
jgi:glycosyltransferase involved in cell wall biosynthesis